LTGKGVDNAATAGRPALVIKIDNAPDAHPQAGLDVADVVMEEVVEGGITRYLAIFQSHDAPLVGPVRSVRPVDPIIVTPLRGLFAASGGAPKFKAALHRAPVQDVGYDALPSAFKPDKSRRAPHNLFTSTAALYAAAKNQPAPPSLFTFVPFGSTFNGIPITSVHAVLSGPVTVDWTWNGTAWQRSTNGKPDSLVGGAPLTFDNVIFQVVPYQLTGDRDVAGNRVPSATVIGSGDAWVLSNGKLVKGHWNRPTEAAITTYVDDAGQPIAITPGRTFIELAPTTAAITPH
jgi:hypothetical protein